VQHPNTDPAGPGAARVRELVDAGNALESSCRIVIPDDRLAEAQRIDTDLQRELDNRSEG
jgi:hypothetical protein